uniref:Uncharacterized protein n=1 Tax=Oryza glumipatula TaxID=40148 RepID=A0A0E0A3I5_9ORYZ
MAAIKLDLPVPGGPYSSFWSMASVSNVDGWWRSIGDHESEYSFMYIWRILSWSFMALAVAMMNGSSSPSSMVTTIFSEDSSMLLTRRRCMLVLMRVAR